MTLQNRVQPTGEIVAHPGRGMLMGNRGILHGADRQLGRRRWTHQAWVTCCLAFKGRHRTVMTPGRYTELFFLDEAVALAAGHRPCGECRRADFIRFRALWTETHQDPDLKTADKRLHRARVTGTRDQIRFEAPLGALPSGAFILHQGAPHLVHNTQLLRYTPSGYTATMARPAGRTQVLTPAPTLAVLVQGYRPTLHLSANQFL